MLGNGLRLSLLGRGHFPAGRRRTPRPAGRPPLRPRACRVASPRWQPPRRSPCSPTCSGLSRKPLTFPWFSSPREPVPSVTDWPVSRRPPSCVSVPAWPRMTPANAHSDSLNNLSTSWCPGARGRSGAASQAPRPRAPADRTPPTRLPTLTPADPAIGGRAGSVLPPALLAPSLWLPHTRLLSVSRWWRSPGTLRLLSSLSLEGMSESRSSLGPWP